MITIKNYISMIYDDFREYIDQNVNLSRIIHGTVSELITVL